VNITSEVNSRYQKRSSFTDFHVFHKLSEAVDIKNFIVTGRRGIEEGNDVMSCDIKISWVCRLCYGLLSYCKLNSSNLIGSLAVIMRLYYLPVAGNISHMTLL
jgi:hypothetical protein